MKKYAPKIISSIILVTFTSAIFCSLGLCSGMMKMANEDESSSMMQKQPPDSNSQNHPCSPSSQSNKSQNCDCCKCIDTLALLQPDHKNQNFTATSDFFKAFPSLATLVNQVSITSHLEVFDHSPPKVALNSTPLYILNRVLRL